MVDGFQESLVLIKTILDKTTAAKRKSPFAAVVRGFAKNKIPKFKMP
jgi:hypothetical protein